MNPGSVDPYLYPGTRVLRNKLGLRDPVALVEAEANLVFAATLELLDNPPRPTGDLGELQAIHRYLFEDLYEWAGQVRTVDLRKDLANGQESSPFLSWRMIEPGAAHAVRELREDDELCGLGRDQFIERLAYHYDQFNHIHPFREGNGRTQRVFWNRISFDAGWELDWTAVQGEVNDRASRVASEDRDLTPLADMFDLVVEPSSHKRRTKVWRSAEIGRLAVPPARGPLKE